MITKDSVETAYSFLHQKQRIYVHSTLDWQKDDIEIAIASYADDMSRELYDAISGGRADFLRDHKRFPDRSMENFEEILRNDLHQFLLSMKEVDERLPECPDVEDKWEEIALEKVTGECASRVYNALRHQNIEPGTKEAFNAYVSCLHQLYLMGAAMQLSRMGYYMKKM